jgi:hypothetical protein
MPVPGADSTNSSREKRDRRDSVTSLMTPVYMPPHHHRLIAMTSRATPSVKWAGYGEPSPVEVLRDGQIRRENSASIGATGIER